MARVLFVCLGNICRSPTAEGVMRRLVAEAGLEGRIELDSAGTGSWHVGAPPDERAVTAASARGVGLEGAARQVRVADLEEFDYVIAMDRANMEDLEAMAVTPEQAEKLALLREHDERAAGAGELEVPDPYGGGAEGFERALDAIEAACRGLLERIVSERHMIRADGNA